ncbi:hypothetical protein BGX34_008388 [Mortierella sp. NVP85]|nr:hypothetical protein BGX34_008388 [Mortierella sp. NVP85]
MLRGLKEYLENSAACDISLASFMKRYNDIHDKDRIISLWYGALSFLKEHSSLEKRQLSWELSKFTRVELEKIVDNELQEREHDSTVLANASRQELAASRMHTKQVEKRFNAAGGDAPKTSITGPVVSSSATSTTPEPHSPSLDDDYVAGQKHPRDSWSDPDETPSKFRRGISCATETVVEHEHEEDIHDLESTDIADRGNPFFFIFQALYDLHYCRPLLEPPRPSNLTEIQGKLFNFIVPKLNQFDSLDQVQKKDVYVASSMIAHLEHEEAEVVFGKDMLDKLGPLIVDEAFSETADEVKVILDNVKEAAMMGNKTLDPKRIRLCVTKELGLAADDELNNVKVDEHKVCILEILRLMAKKSEKPFANIPKETEAMTVRVWQDIFDILFEGSGVSVTTGETGLAASREERTANEQAHGGVQTPATPRKVDFLLLTSVELQRKLVHIEIADYEHKGSKATDEDVAVQLRKSIRHNHAILTRLPILDEIIFLDIKGFTARVMRLRRHESVFICGTMADEIILPVTPAQLEIFMKGRSLSALFRLRDHVLDTASKVQASILQPKKPPLLRTLTPPPVPRPATFYTPTKRTK